MLDVLAGKVIFQFDRNNGQAIEQNHYIDGLIGRPGGEMDLPHDGKAVACIAGLMLLITARRWAKIGQLQIDAIERYAVSENIQGSTLLNQASDMPGQRLVGRIGKLLAQLAEFFGLGGGDEVP